MFCMWTTGTAVPPFFIIYWDAKLVPQWLVRSNRKGMPKFREKMSMGDLEHFNNGQMLANAKMPCDLLVTGTGALQALGVHEVLFPPDRHSWTEPTTAALKTASVYRPEAAAETHRNTSLLVLWPKCRHMHKHRVQTLFITKHTCTPETECGTSGRADWLLPLVSRKKNKHR